MSSQISYKVIKPNKEKIIFFRGWTPAEKLEFALQ